MFLAGQFFGAIISGLASDKFGRKIVLIILSVTMTGFSIGTAFAPDIITYTVLRFFTGAVSMGLFTVSYCYGLEHMGGKWRIIYGIGYQMTWSFAYCAIVGIAYAEPDWVKLQLIVSVPSVLYSPMTILLPESPKWLLAVGKIEKAEKITSKIAKFNKRHFETIRLEAEVETESAGFADLFRTPNLRRMTLLLFFVWWAVPLAYYGMVFSTGVLIPEAGFYLNYFIYGVVEIPASTLAIVVLFYVGRRITLSAAITLGGVSLLLMLAVLDSVAASLTFSALSKFGLASGFAMIYMYTLELFPTTLRATGLGATSMWSPVGGVLAPIIGGYLGTVNRVIPIAIFGSLAVISGFVILLLPETKDRALPDSVEQGEKFATVENSVFGFCRRRKSFAGDKTSRAVESSCCEDDDVNSVITSSSVTSLDNKVL